MRFYLTSYNNERILKIITFWLIYKLIHSCVYIFFIICAKHTNTNFVFFLFSLFSLFYKWKWWCLYIENILCIFMLNDNNRHQKQQNHKYACQTIIIIFTKNEKLILVKTKTKQSIFKINDVSHLFICKWKKKNKKILIL